MRDIHGLVTIQPIAPEDTWPIRQVVLWPEKPMDFVKLDGDDKALHFGLYVKGQLTSVVSCFEDQDEMQFRKFATLIDRQNRGFGTCLLNYIIDEARRRGVKRLWCSARSDKSGFYEKLGLETTGNRFVRDRMEYVTMEMRFNRDFGSNP